MATTTDANQVISKASDRRAGLASLGWTGLSQCIGLVIRLASNLILARLLAPQAYGLLGTALAVMTTLEWLSDLGVQPALVRHPRGCEDAYLQTGWTLGLFRGVVVTLAAIATAGPMASFSHQPALIGILMGLACRPAIFALRSPGMPTLRRNLNYRGLFIDETAQTAVGTAVSLLLAWTTHSIWAIVGGTLAGAVTGVVVSYLLSPIRPKLTWDRVAASEIGHLGRQVFINTLVMALWMNLDRILGLRFISLPEMGLYAVAWNLAGVLETLVTRACDVYFSMLVRRGGAEAQDRWHAKVCRRAVEFGVPLGILAIALAPKVINVLYDERYRAAGPLFAVLIARLLIRSLGQIQFQYLLARAEVHTATRAYLVALVVQTGLFFALVPRYGPMGLALAALGSTTTLTLVQTWLLSRKTGWGLGGFAWTSLGMAAGILLAVRPF